MINQLKRFVFPILFFIAIPYSYSQKTYAPNFWGTPTKSQVEFLRRNLIWDSSECELLLIWDVWYSPTAYGTRIIMKGDSIRANRLLFKGEYTNYIEVEQDKKLIEINYDFLKNFFINPYLYLKDTFFIQKGAGLSHDNTSYLLVKIHKRLYFEKYFLRSTPFVSGNEDIVKLITVLFDLSEDELHEPKKDPKHRTKKDKIRN